MNPKEKAKELVDKYLEFVDDNSRTKLSELQNAKKCALIAVDLRLYGHFSFTSIEYGDDASEYWEQVISEIEKL
jgi:hypothetical protein